MSAQKTIARSRLVKYLDEYLDVATIPDKSLNGLQVDGASTVKRAAFAVDACLETIKAAGRWKADILIVHHGLFWGRDERITGVTYKRVAELVRRRLSLYAVHLPLDCHDEVGNNVELARILGLSEGKRFGRYHGVDIGRLAFPARPLRRSELVERIEKSLKTKADVLPFGPPRITSIGIISGGAAEFAATAREVGCDTLITGETSHVAYHLAREAGINVFYAGHYASETVGVRALARHLAEKFSLQCRFIPAPTGY